MFLYKNLFFRYLFFQSQSCLLESTAAFFRQSAGYVYFVSWDWLEVTETGVKINAAREIKCFSHNVELKLKKGAS